MYNMIYRTGVSSNNFTDLAWRFMRTYNPTSKSTYDLLRRLRGLTSTLIFGLISAHEPPRKQLKEFMFSPKP